jgi:hypothetical protein
MAKKKQKKKQKKSHTRPALNKEECTQLQILLDRVMAQDPRGDRFTRFVESLEPLIQRSVPFTLAFVEALGSASSPVAVKVLQGLEEMEAEKPVRRAVKTALYRLARQGLLYEREETHSDPVVLVPRPMDRQTEAWVSWPESEGERGVVLKMPRAGRGYLMAIGLLNSEGILYELDAFQTTRKGVKELLEKMTDGVSGRLIEIPLAHVRFLYEEIAETHQRQNKELPTGYDMIYKQLASQVDQPTRPHVYKLLDEKEIAGDISLLRSSDGLFETQPFVSWRLPGELVTPFVDKIKQLRESRLVLSESVQRERAGQIYHEAATEIFTPEVRKRYCRLLEEAALLLYLQNREKEARLVMAVASDLKTEEGMSSENSFVVGLVKRSIVAELGFDPEEAEEEPPPAEKMTESGLIIPR